MAASDCGTSGGVDCWDGALGEWAAAGVDQGLRLRTSKLAAVEGSVVVVVECGDGVAGKKMRSIIFYCMAKMVVRDRARGHVPC
jgi:hypothetical protein